MRIDFFEEFPTDENLGKAALLSFPSTIYIAAPSFEQFLGYKNKLATINPHCEAGYWPTFARSYWISPFSYPEEIDRLIAELENYNGDEVLKVLIDLELPLLHKSLFIKNSLFFFQNKRKIKKLLSGNSTKKIVFYTAEYPPMGKMSRWLSRKLGISYTLQQFNHIPIFMFYTSMIEQYGNNLHIDLSRHINGYLTKNAKEIKNIQLGLGTIAQGILGTEPVLSPSKLEQDLGFLKSLKVETAVIFRLGGLTKEYLDVILPYI
ncbi:MAG: hypothetical protein K0S38_348 [Candidatus Paceibacter sp.]|jgi:hypothetical protein|nr:hypothetical protein [Candidatus Paceibacter sp.]